MTQQQFESIVATTVTLTVKLFQINGNLYQQLPPLFERILTNFEAGIFIKYHRGSNTHNQYIQKIDILNVKATITRHDKTLYD